MKKHSLFNHIQKLRLQIYVSLIFAAMIVLFAPQIVAAADGDLDQTFNATVDDGAVNTIVVQPNGKILIGGTFTTVGGAARKGVARLNADGSLDAGFTVGTGIAGNSSQIFSIAVQTDGKILIAGSFNSFNGTTRGNIARLNADGSLDATYNPNASADVRTINLRADGTVFVGGNFSTIGGATRSRLAQLDANGAATSFNPVTIASIGQHRVNYFAVQADGKILITGLFNLGGRTHLARLNADGSLDTTFTPPFSSITGINQLKVLPLPDGRVVAAIDINYDSGASRHGLARYLANGDLDAGFNPFSNASSSNPVADFYLQPDGKIVAGGTFSLGAHANIVRVNADGTIDQTFNATANSSVYATVPQPDGKLLIGGLFTSVNGTPRLRVARLSNDPGTTRRPQFDFDGDGKSDISVFRPPNGTWYLQRSQNGFTGAAFGLGTDKLAPADFDGDGKTDIAVYRDGSWYILQSSNSQVRGVAFGAAEDLPRPGDFDGDGKADISVFRPSNGTWYRLNSSNAQFVGTTFGQADDAPLVADFDGDSKSDIAVFRQGVWYYLQSSDGGFRGVSFGAAGDIPTAGDYDGDNKSDIAVFRPSNGTWYRINSSNGAFVGVAFGQSGDRPAPGDYDGDGKTDIAVFRAGVWYYLQSSNGSLAGVTFGTSSDAPVPAAFLP